MLSGQVGQSKADNKLQQWFIEPAFNGGFSWDINRGISYDDPAAARDPANWKAEGFFGNTGIFSTRAKDTYGQIDFTKHFDSVFNSLQVGLRRTKHEEDFSLNVYGIPPTGDLSQVGSIGFTDLSGFAPDHGQHLYVGRNNVIDWVNNAPPTSPIPTPPASSTIPTRSSRPTKRHMRSRTSAPTACAATSACATSRPTFPVPRSTSAATSRPCRPGELGGDAGQRQRLRAAVVQHRLGRRDAMSCCAAPPPKSSPGRRTTRKCTTRSSTTRC